MPESTYLGLPFLEAGQAQKHVTHNEALRILDALVQLSVSAISASPPGSPAEGERHIVAAGASGSFASQEHKVAIYEDGTWRFLTPRTGWRAWNEDEETLLLWNGSEWSALETGGGGGGGGFDPEDVTHIYLNDASPGDPNVKFAMRGKTALLHAIPAAESGDGDVQLQISKETASDTASVYFSTNFSGRAEFGLAGSDNFKLKVSPNGSSWTEALDIDRTTGRVRLPAMLALTNADQAVAFRDIRERLTANRTYYVRADGSDSNTGLANNAGGAFLTIQKAIDVVASIDISIYTVVIQVANGTWTQGLTLKDPIGGGAEKCVLRGDVTTPSNVVLSTGSNRPIHSQNTTRWKVEGFSMTCTTDILVYAELNSLLSLGVNRYGAAASGSGIGVFSDSNSTVRQMGNFEIAGGSWTSFFYARNGWLDVRFRTCTLTSTPAWNILAFVAVSVNSVVLASGMSFSGSATGPRYSSTLNAVIDTGGGGANYFPGKSAGSTATGGLYA